MTASGDKVLIEAVFAGEKEAFGELYDRYAPLVRAVCYDKTGSLADAQDLAQDVFLRAYERLGRLREPDRFGRWLIGIARLRCKEWRRQKLRSREKFAGQTNTDSYICEPSHDGQIEKLLKVITKLPEKERLAVHAFYLRSGSAEDARRVMGLSRSGFYRVLERARGRLKQLINQKQEQVL
ncbi:MAG: sigma-70 family RNA polymerase sigma factor [Sedimentisphaerales bacterium]|nr:sigma-70 family RNA polymerase sigma factor [Sedimentisphaerales bacterium]